MAVSRGSETNDMGQRFAIRDLRFAIEDGPTRVAACLDISGGRSCEASLRPVFRLIGHRALGIVHLELPMHNDNYPMHNEKRRWACPRPLLPLSAGPHPGGLIPDALAGLCTFHWLSPHKVSQSKASISG